MSVFDNNGLVGQPDQSTQDVNTADDSSKPAGEEASTSSVPDGNRFAEVLRKQGKTDKTLSNMQESITKLTEALQQTLSAPQATESTEDLYMDENVVRYTDARLGTVKNDVEALRTEVANERHREEFAKATAVYPELDQESDRFDQAFYDKVDQNFRSFASLGSRTAVSDAVALAAAKSGKIKQIEQQRLLEDEARRARTIGEGGISPRDADRNRDPVPESVKTLASLLPSAKKLTSADLTKLYTSKE